jgi:hypothetical protein
MTGKDPVSGDADREDERRRDEHRDRGLLLPSPT